MIIQVRIKAVRLGIGLVIKSLLYLKKTIEIEDNNFILILVNKEGIKDVKKSCILSRCCLAVVVYGGK